MLCINVYEIITLTLQGSFPLCWRHTVPKLTPDGHTNVEICISREVGPELGTKAKTSTMPEKLHRLLYHGLRCTHELPDVFTNWAESKQILRRVSIFAQLRDSVTPASAKTR